MEHGIVFERLSNGDGRYTVNIMVDGSRVHRVIGKESDGVTREQAEQFIEQARTQARQWRLNLPKGRKVRLGFRDAAQKYLERLQQEGGRDLKMKRYRLSMHLVPFFQDKPLDKITSFDVERNKKERLEQEAKPGTVNRELAALSHLFTTYLTTDQIQRLLEAARSDQSWQVYPFIVIGLETSMRRMEILSIGPA
jgi:hypothetical protein